MGFTVDTTPEPHAFEMPDGLYHAEVAKAVEGKSKSSGANMFTITLVAIDHGKRKLCQDWIMMGGAAKGMGIQKLKALGIDMSSKSVFVDASMITGRRCWVNVAQDEYPGRDGPRTSLKVKRMDKGDLGYFPDGDRPLGPLAEPKAAPVADGDSGEPMDDTPF